MVAISSQPSKDVNYSFGSLPSPPFLALSLCPLSLEFLLLFGRKVMTNLDSILKSRDTTLLTKVRLVKAMVFPVVMYGCESWTIKKVEYRRIDAFAPWCWKKTLESPLDYKEIKPVNTKGNQPFRIDY